MRSDPGLRGNPGLEVEPMIEACVKPSPTWILPWRAALPGGPDRFARLAAEAATPGGLNAQVVGMLRAGGAHTDVREALDAALARISFQPPIR